MELIYTEQDLPSIARTILEYVDTKILAFYAPMGAGKTTLIKALVRELGSTDNVSSPTFGLVNEYQLDNGELLAYHFDFYRLKDETEALDMGLDDYLQSNAWIFMEWPEKIPNLTPENMHTLKIEILDQKTRKLTLV
ncbi:tRNA threonylcarbamoyladenosine biosynthesis protein TsaE [Maribacter sedimenticola]|uniref:tRNA threonylcarbamoyladenosine biosynthesis protein TsaE n=1 Tax=Maribacter sedimenticola TaxID=228956 RepID=A0ABY1SH07_9FLAO|nr:tRNA (adenosine(37)-N6)-threonylcarbamoyltransferase complex ATPase subunit type 1 TsaE [Maribacter sedimenticola]SNR47850.1 tRNA threonylcarbamoyladenosine biosynthesis protein TsaE [Maribacter sedimenticola]